MKEAKPCAKSKPLLALVIDQSGNCLAIYDDAWAFTQLGKVSISRASHVEPDADGNWLADLSPVGGPTFGPFHQRSDALEAERRWLNRNLHQLVRPGDS